MHTLFLCAFVCIFLPPSPFCAVIFLSVFKSAHLDLSVYLFFGLSSLSFSELGIKKKKKKNTQKACALYVDKCNQACREGGNEEAGELAVLLK